MTDKQSVAEIAGKLTKAQRECLVAHNPHYGHHDHGWPGSAIEDAHSFAQAGRPMMVMNLITWTRDPRSSMTVLTNLGASVKAHLSTEYSK